MIKVNEFSAIGIGGTSLAGNERSALVVSLGTGTAIVSVTGDKIAHFSGTGVGGGTLRGLSKHMLGVSTIEALEKLARTRRPIAHRSHRSRYRRRRDRRLPPDTTASNFGKISADATPRTRRSRS